MTDLHFFCFSGKLVTKTTNQLHMARRLLPPTPSLHSLAALGRHRAGGWVWFPVLRMLLRHSAFSATEARFRERILSALTDAVGEGGAPVGAGRRCPFPPLATPPVSLPVTALAGRPLPSSSALLRVGHRCPSSRKVTITLKRWVCPSGT